MSSSVTLGGGASWEEHSREGVHCPRAPQAGAAQSSRDMCASGGRGAQRQAEKDTTVPLARHTRAHTHTAFEQPWWRTHLPEHRCVWASC